MEAQERAPVFGAGRGRVVDDVPRPVKELKGALRGVLGDLLRQTLDREQAVIFNDRQFEIVKKQTMDAFGAAERSAMAIVSRLLLQGDWNGNRTTDADNGTSR
jgi:hypothetical protein